MFLQNLNPLLFTILMPFTESSSTTLSAETVLDKYIEAIGGRAAIEKINTKVIATTTLIPSKKQKIETTMFIKNPDKAYVVVEFKLGGKTIKSEGGRNADIVWQITPGLFRRNYKIFTGKEKELKFADLAFDTAAVSWKKYYKSISLIGEEEIDAKPCFKVAFTPFDQTYTDTICFFEKETFLIKKIIRDTYFQNHSGTAQTYLSDYKKVDSILIPHTFKRLSEATQDLFITIDSIRCNVDIADSKFELPKKIKELSKKAG